MSNNRPSKHKTGGGKLSKSKSKSILNKKNHHHHHKKRNNSDGRAPVIKKSKSAAIQHLSRGTIIARIHGVDPVLISKHQSLLSATSTNSSNDLDTDDQNSPLPAIFDSDRYSYHATCSYNSDANSDNFTDCECLHRLIFALQFYQSTGVTQYKTDAKTDRIVEFVHTKYKTQRMLDDFFHVSLMHSASLEQVQKYVQQQLGMKKRCDATQCLLLARHQRDRSMDRDHGTRVQDEAWIFVRDTFDNIHAYIFHTFDVGLRTKQNDLQRIIQRYYEQQKHGALQLQDMDGGTGFDAAFKQIKHLLHQTTCKLKPFDRFKSTKFRIDGRRVEQQRGVSWRDGMFERLTQQKPAMSFVRLAHLEMFLEHQEFDSDAIMADVDEYLYDEQTKRKSRKTSNLAALFGTDLNGLQVVCDYVKECSLNDKAFSTGFVFYYWPFYKHLTTKPSHGNNETFVQQNPSLCYVERKYPTLKAEIISNEIFKLEPHIFADAEKKAKLYTQTSRAKSMFAISDFLHYGIVQYSCISQQHLLSVILYCDCSDLCTAFSSTFRRVRSFETLASVKQRNAEFANLSRLLRETVEMFGEHRGFYDSALGQWSGVCGPFYSGLSFLCVVPEFNIRLCGPTSTSKQLAVAMRFGGDNGIIVELDNQGSDTAEYLRCFNCSWISNFSGEDERLFFGGRYRLQVKSIRLIESAQNFAPFMQTLYYFDCMLNGCSLEAAGVNATKWSIKDQHYKILDALIDHKLQRKFNKFDSYINRTFAVFCAQKMKIVLNVHCLYTYFEKLSPLIWRKSVHVFRYKLLRLFVNLRVITIETTSVQTPSGGYMVDPEELRSVLARKCCAHRLRIEIKADWKSLYDLSYKYKSWISHEYERAEWRSFIDDGYTMDKQVLHVNYLYPSDCLTIFKT